MKPSATIRLLGLSLVAIHCGSAQPLVPRDVIWQNNFEANTAGAATGANPTPIIGFRGNEPGGVVRDSSVVQAFGTNHNYLELSPSNNSNPNNGYAARVSAITRAHFEATPVSISFDFNESTATGNQWLIGVGTGAQAFNPDLNATVGLLAFRFQNGVTTLGANTAVASGSLPAFTEGKAYRLTMITNFTGTTAEVTGPDGEVFDLEDYQAAIWFYDLDEKTYTPRVVIRHSPATPLALNTFVTFMFRHFSISDGDPAKMQTSYVDNVVATNFGKPALVWSGGAANALWSTAGNWQAGAAPQANDSLVFSGNQNLSPVNDLPANTLIEEIVIQDTTSSFAFSGNPVALGRRFSNLSASDQTIGMPLVIDPAALALDNLTAGTTLALTAPVTGTGGFVKKGAGTVALSATNEFAGSKILDQGTVVVSGNQAASSGTWYLRGFGASGTTLGSAPTTVSFDTGASIAVTEPAFVQIGHTGAVGGTQPQTVNSSAIVTNGGTLYVGRAGTLTLNSGSWTQNGAASVVTQGGGQATLRVNATASFTYTHPADFVLSIGTSNNTRTRLDINGGTFVTGSRIHTAQANLSPEDSAFCDILLRNGGTLRLAADIPDLFTTAGANTRFLAEDGGGVIDTNGSATTLNLPITGNGGLTKAGTGTLTTTGENDYAGNTSVTGGTLVLSSAGLNDDASVTVANGAMLMLDFSGIDTIAGLTLGSSILDDGIYDATSHPTFLSGSGRLVVVKPVTPGGFASWANGLGLSGNPDADFDNDGLADSLEYILGTDPKAPNQSGIAVTRNSSEFILSFNRDDASETPDVSLAVEVGNALASWPQVFNIGADNAGSSAGVNVVENGENPDTITVTVPTAGADRLFGRLKVTVATGP